MPIYAYRCTSCGHAKDVLQKMSDPLLTVCPDCGASTFVKQVTAAGFQLKGSGWYVTDYAGKATKGSDSESEAKTEKSEKKTTKESSPAKKSDKSSATKTSSSD